MKISDTATPTASESSSEAPSSQTPAAESSNPTGKPRKARKKGKTTNGANGKGTKKGTKKANGKGAKGAKKGATKKADSAPKEKPTTGQSGPRVDLGFTDLNKKESAVLLAINGKGEGPRSEITISEVCGKVFRGADTTAQRNSWVRNSLRRLVTSEFVEKLSRGTYRVTDKGRKRIGRAEA